MRWAREGGIMLRQKGMARTSREEGGERASTIGCASPSPYRDPACPRAPHGPPSAHRPGRAAGGVPGAASAPPAALRPYGCGDLGTAGGVDGGAAWAARVAAFVYLVGYVALDAISGVAASAILASGEPWSTEAARALF